MSGEPSGSGHKSEQASKKKLDKAREKGQVPRSRDLAAAVGLLIAFELLLLLAPRWLAALRMLFAAAFADLAGEHTLDDIWSIPVASLPQALFTFLVPFVAIPVSIVLGSLYPGGWAPCKENFFPKLERFDPITNLGRLITLKHYGTLAISVAKVITLTAVLSFLVSRALPDFLSLQGKPLMEALSAASALMIRTVRYLILILVVFAFIDAPFQKFLFLHGQRMTKKEVTDEHKQSEGNPEIKSRLRQLQRQLATRGLNKTVPGADVVIVNPTHYAVALKYDIDRADAPFVVAKGQDERALIIQRLAVQHGIEILPLAPLARAIYHTSHVNQKIPATLYRAVAQVLTYVIQLRAFQDGRRDKRPLRPERVEMPTSADKQQR